ncbi:MAG: SDR family NAD(P)-dependent oxidoreductase [Dehalococcoidia bacterium]|nr:SDR family NAD(P)-dependent oxidoreductase [Dehalococcoidia bacterium]
MVKYLSGMLSGKVAIVTGSSRGIGKAIALELARAGADVVVAARTEIEGKKLPGTIHQTASEIRAMNRQALAIKTNLTQEQDIENLVSQALNHFGHVDILVNNAAISTRGTLLEVPLNQYDLLWSVNVRGPVMCTRAVLPHMIARRSGSIINVSSAISFIAADPDLEKRLGTSTSVAYSMTKAAVNVLTVVLAKEVAPHNITVNAFEPVWTATEGMLILHPEPPPSVPVQSPQMWGKYAVLVACSKLHGQLLTEEMLRQQFGPV